MLKRTIPVWVKESSFIIPILFELIKLAALRTYKRLVTALLYEMLGEPAFAHDFDNVEYEADAFDLALGTPGLHQVRRKVEWVERDTVLPPDLFSRFQNDAFWPVAENNLHNVRIISYNAA